MQFAKMHIYAYLTNLATISSIIYVLYAINKARAVAFIRIFNLSESNFIYFFVECFS